jgi:hypothetical protein
MTVEAFATHWRKYLELRKRFPYGAHDLVGQSHPLYLQSTEMWKREDDYRDWKAEQAARS